MENGRVLFRQLKFTEAEQITLLSERATAKRDGNPLPTSVNKEGLVEHTQQRMSRTGAWTLAAVHNAHIVGFVLSHPLVNKRYEEAATNTEHLPLLMIDPDYWGQRIASKLLDQAGDHARTTNKRRLTLWTNKDNNARARSIYEHKGFVLSGGSKLSPYGEQVHYQLYL